MSKRIFYASHAVGITKVVDGNDVVVAKPAEINFDTIEGAQSVSLNTNYNLEQIFQLGRLEVYDQVSTDPEVEITISKALDGRPLIWNRAINALSGGIKDKANHKPDIVLHVDEETQDAIDSDPTAAIKMTGCFFSSLNYTFPVDGNFIEELSFVASNKAACNDDGDALGGPGNIPPAAPYADPWNNVLRRQNFNISTSTLPSGVAGKCITNVTISASVNREKMFCLGQYSPYHRYINYPIEITIAFDVNPDGDAADSLAGPDFSPAVVVECGASSDIVGKEEIIINLCHKSPETQENDIIYSFDLGSGCTLQSVSYSGGDTGGGNVTETYTYVSYNILDITYSPA